MKMVQEMTSKRRRSVPAPLNLDITYDSLVSHTAYLSDGQGEECVATAFSNALSFKKVKIIYYSNLTIY